MPDDQTQAVAPDDQTQRIVKGLLAQALSQPQVPTSTRAQVEQPSSFIGLLGSALGGGPSGAVPMSADESDAAGRRALMNFGMNLLANSGWSSQRRTAGQIFAGGMGAAQQSLGQSEELKAARGAAQQDYAAQQQQLAIARVKEALPLLDLSDQIRRANSAIGQLPKPNPSLSIGAVGAPGTTGGQTASADVPPELMPHYLAASQETGIPVAVLIAKDKQESNFNNSLRGGAGEIGIAQVLPGTAAAPGYGVAGVDPKTLADPGENIRFGARYFAARGKAAGVKDWNNPDDIAKALTAYNGGGDKDYAAHVMRYLPGAKPGAPGASTAAAAPDVAPTGNRFAGPGVPTVPAAGGTVAEQPENQALINRLSSIGGAPPAEPTASPGATAAADIIKQGMIARGADPKTLAPSPGVPGAGGTQEAAAAAPASDAPPVVPASPPAPTVGQAAAPEPQVLQPDVPIPGGGVIRHPGTPMEFRARNYTPPPTTEDFNPNLTDADRKGFAERQAGIESDKRAIGNLKRDKVPEAVQALNDKQTQLNVDFQAALQAKRAKADAAVTKWNNDQNTASDKIYETTLKAYQDAVQANLTNSHQIAVENVKAGQNLHQKLAENDATEGNTLLGKMDEAAHGASGMQSILAMVGPQLKNLPSGMVAQVLDSHPGLVPFLRTMHVLDGPQADATQLIQGLTAFMATEMKPKGLGPLRIQEMNAFQGALPTLLQSDEGRQKAYAFINAYTNRIQQEAEFAHDHFKRQVPNTAPDAAPGSMMTAHNMEKLWSTMAKPADQGGLGSVLPMWTGSVKSKEDLDKYNAWEAQQRAQPGNPYWALRRNPKTGVREMELTITPPTGG